MSRTKTYESAAVVEKAMYVFWERGYEMTSIEDLTASTGLSRSSLYAEFGSKRALFDVVLDRYLKGINRITAPLEEPKGLAAIAEFFAILRQARFDPDPTFGCLIVNSIADLAPADTAFFERSIDYQSLLITAFERALKAAEASGEISSGKAGQRAELLTALVMGIFVASRGQPDEARIDSLIDAAIDQVLSWSQQ